MPDMSGLELQAELARRKINLPVIFVSGQGMSRWRFRRYGQEQPISSKSYSPAGPCWTA